MEFEDESDARSWSDYLEREGELTDADMTGVELSYLEMVDQGRLTPA